MELSSNQQQFLDRCTEVRRIALSFRNPLVVHHHDADGLSSGAIVAYALGRANVPHRIRCVKTLDDHVIESLREEKEVIFTDLGSGNPKVDELQDVVVIDHHQPVPISKPQANCMLFGLDGGRELSAASSAYLVFRQRVDLGVVGAVGDLQGPFQGLNQHMALEGQASGEVRIEKDLGFYGRFSRPLIPFLLYADEIYIPGFSYQEERIAEFLRDLSIPLKEGERWRAYADLEASEKQKLISGLTEMLIASGRGAEAERLIREGYVFPKNPRNETYEANEFSTLLNACGRNGRPEVGLGVCLNQPEAYTEAKQLLELHRRNIREGIAYAQQHVQDFGLFYFLDGRGVIGETIIGIICGMWLRSNAPKPVLGVSQSEEGELKASGRANGMLVRQGLNIGLLLRAAAADAGGIGGGHRAAGGATFPKEKINEFLLAVGAELRRSSNIRPLS